MGYFSVFYGWKRQWRIQAGGGGRPPDIHWMHLKNGEKHKNASFLLKILKNFLGKGQDPLLRPFRFPYFQVLDPPLGRGSVKPLTANQTRKLGQSPTCERPAL